MVEGAACAVLLAGFVSLVPTCTAAGRSHEASRSPPSNENGGGTCACVVWRRATPNRCLPVVLRKAKAPARARGRFVKSNHPSFLPFSLSHSFLDDHQWWHLASPRHPRLRPIATFFLPRRGIQFTVHSFMVVLCQIIRQDSSGSTVRSRCLSTNIIGRCGCNTEAFSDFPQRTPNYYYFTHFEMFFFVCVK